MSRNPAKLIPTDFSQLPGLDALEAVTIKAGGPSKKTTATGYAVTSDQMPPRSLGLSRDALEKHRFDGEVGQTLVLAQEDGTVKIAVGLGRAEEVDANVLRDSAAAFARAAADHSDIAFVISDALEEEDAARFLTEGILLARYRYVELKNEPKHTALSSVMLDISATKSREIASGINKGKVAARATIVARDLTNTPPGHLTATDFAEVVKTLGRKYGFDVKSFDKAALIKMGCGGLLGVNRGSAEEPRLIKLHYRPRKAIGHLGIVGKGITYDSGGISLKPSDPMHLLMKMDMGGAGAVTGAFTALADAGVSCEVTGWLMCTDNMISGDAYRLGDVLVAADGTTVEITNTDAEGRVVMMDGLALAHQEHVDAVVDIATLTGASIVALGEKYAAVFSNSDQLGDMVVESAHAVDEPVWHLPLEQSYRKNMQSKVADMTNAASNRFGGAITAALFLEHFAGDTPWAHIDIAGPMQVDKDDLWRSGGATGFGARTLVELAKNFNA